MNQNFKNYKLVVSECRNSDVDSTINEFVDYIKSIGGYYSIVHGDLPNHQSYNTSVRQVVKELGEFEYYLYVSSGISFNPPFDEQMPGNMPKESKELFFLT